MSGIRQLNEAAPSERPYQLMAHSGVVGGVRGDKAVKRKAALTMAGGKYQEN